MTKARKNLLLLKNCQSDDSTSEESTESVNSPRTVCRITAFITRWYVKMAVLETTCITREHDTRENW